MRVVPGGDRLARHGHVVDPGEGEAVEPAVPRDGQPDGMSITLPAASACRGCAAQNDGSPVIGVVVPGGV